MADAKQPKASLNVRLDPALKEKATAVAERMGMDLSAVVRLTLTAMVKEGRLPFAPAPLPADTLEAMVDAKHQERLNHYSNVDDMLRQLGV